MMTKCMKGHERFTSGPNAPGPCAWPDCPHGTNGDLVRVRVVKHAPVEPITWGVRPAVFQENVELFFEWRREQGWRPNGQVVFRWVMP